ncbi:hypothetical protein LI142_10890 [Eubacterium limosum]|uniref:hypothetical protein n=1 Tax=Eubacterium limosum TaxID=1736 RepID=UPI001D0887C9|nr:hypothetical protein [Eubacterium limosum]MCB6570005.1 hypothetical protein [Eubacterium limosum]
MSNKEINAIEAIDQLIVRAKEYYGDDFSVEDGIVGVFPNAIMKISMEDHQMKVELAGDHPFIFKESLDCFEELENEE